MMEYICFVCENPTDGMYKMTAKVMGLECDVIVCEECFKKHNAIQELKLNVEVMDDIA